MERLHLNFHSLWMVEIWLSNGKSKVLEKKIRFDEISQDFSSMYLSILAVIPSSKTFWIKWTSMHFFYMFMSAIIV